MANEHAALSRCLAAVIQVMDDPGPEGFLAWLGMDVEVVGSDLLLSPVAMVDATTARVAGTVDGSRILATFEVIQDDDR